MGGDVDGDPTPDGPEDGETADAPVSRRRVLRALGAATGLSTFSVFGGVGEGLGSDDRARATPAFVTTAPAETTAVTATTEMNEATTTASGSRTVVEVVVGPEDNSHRFVPRRVTIPVGGTVRWRFATDGHNVSARPRASPRVRLPAGAEPFSSYPPGESFVFASEGSTYEHRFTVPGRYVYVSVPDAGEGMVGTVVVTDRSGEDAGDGATENAGGRTTGGGSGRASGTARTTTSS